MLLVLEQLPFCICAFVIFLSYGLKLNIFSSLFGEAQGKPSKAIVDCLAVFGVSLITVSSFHHCRNYTHKGMVSEPTLTLIQPSFSRNLVRSVKVNHYQPKLNYILLV